MQDPNLPPGCTNADIDRAFGDEPMKDCPTCDCAGEVPEPDPTRWQRFKRFFGIETWITCPECNGDLEIPVTEDDIADAKADAADRAYDAWRDSQMGL